MTKPTWLHPSHWPLLAISLHQAGVRRLVICPGSRSAPLTLSLVRSGLFEYAVSVDERSAGFVALGMSLPTQSPVAVVCTSGTALLNLGPAVAEAFYQRIPLIVLSADRPLGYADHQKGQVIRQNMVFKAHTQASFCWVNPSDHPKAHEESMGTLSGLFETAIRQTGPVHLNIPLQEPLYEIPEPLRTPGILTQSHTMDTMDGRPSPSVKTDPPYGLEEAWKNAILKSQKIWLLAGMGRYPEAVHQLLHSLLEQIPQCTLWSEEIANLPVGSRINEISWNRFPPQAPDLLISWGGPLVSKALARCLSLNPSMQHWRLDPRGDAIDTYDRLDGVWTTTASVGLEQLLEWSRSLHGSNEPQKNQSVVTQDQYPHHRPDYPEVSPLPFSDIWVLEALKPHLNRAVIHVGNSSLIRKFLAIPQFPHFQAIVHGNRGTSGIEGNVSTALGEALARKSDQEVWLLNGDLATVYDAGAWLVEPRPLVRVVVFNNNGGDIFRQLPGSSAQEECEPLFATPRTIDWASWCAGYGLPWRQVQSKGDWEQALAWLKNQNQSAVLEVCTTMSANREAEQIFASTLTTA